MKQAAGGDAMVRFGDRKYVLRSIVSDLTSLISRVESSAELVETALAREAALNNPEAANIIVLDDVTPCYLRAQAALRACGSGLGAALRLLQDARAEEVVLNPRRSVRAIV